MQRGRLERKRLYGGVDYQCCVRGFVCVVVSVWLCVCVAVCKWLCVSSHVWLCVAACVVVCVMAWWWCGCVFGRDADSHVGKSWADTTCPRNGLAPAETGHLPVTCARLAPGAWRLHPRSPTHSCAADGLRSCSAHLGAGSRAKSSGVREAPEPCHTLGIQKKAERECAETDRGRLARVPKCQTERASEGRAWRAEEKNHRNTESTRQVYMKLEYGDPYLGARRARGLQRGAAEPLPCHARTGSRSRPV